uniref:Prolyl endopeptidase n=1 Tax=Neobodo designis TaxID=312471 RepID=A0A7S1KWC1_NEODS
MQRLAYPAVRRAAHTYTKHGRVIPDPYHWLENPDSDETKAFVTAQNDVFEQYMKAFPHRDEVKDAIKGMLDYPRRSCPSLRGGRFYFSHNTGLQNQSVLYRQATLDADATPEVFLDPNTLSEDGTSSLGATAWSESDKFYAYVVNEKGSDWGAISVRDAATATNLPDVVDWVKFSGITWVGDDGFFYTRFPKPESGRKEETGPLEDAAVYFHKLGSSQDDDVRVLDIPENRKWLMGVELTDCREKVVISVHDGCEPHNQLWLAPLPKDFAEKPRRLEVTKLVDKFEAEYEYLANDGATMYLLTTKDAPLKRVTAINTDKPEEGQKELIAESDAKIDFCAVVRDTLLIAYLRDVKHVLYRCPLGGSASDLVPFGLPIGTISGMHARRKSDFVSVALTSFLLPNRVLHFDINKPDELSVFFDAKVAGFDPDDFVTEQVFVESDGEKVPMFVCHKKGITLDGTNPTLLYGYGGFNISVTPSFSATRLVFLARMGGVLAVANIRGGGEYGERWHQGGAKFNKMNCYVDFCNCAKWLQAKKYATKEKLAIMGGSNGGLLVAACANKAPHLFSAVVCQVGVLDLYRFHEFTIGHAWTSDFGDPEVEADFDYLTQYSPIHNVKPNTAYPAILVATADHDDRVVPAHSHKYIATLQHVNPEAGGPFLARIEVNAGHGAGKPTHKIIAEAADTYGFLAQALGAKWQ